MRLSPIIIGLAILSGCAGSAWDRYPASLYSVLREETPAAVTAHEKLLGEVLTDAKKFGRKPPAGIAVEYAYYSWRLGKQDAAREALRLEEANYPESRQFVTIAERFLPSLAVIKAAPTVAPKK